MSAMRSGSAKRDNTWLGEDDEEQTAIKRHKPEPTLSTTLPIRDIYFEELMTVNVRTVIRQYFTNLNYPIPMQKNMCRFGSYRSVEGITDFANWRAIKNGTYWYIDPSDGETKTITTNNVLAIDYHEHLVGNYLPYPPFGGDRSKWRDHEKMRYTKTMPHVTRHTNLIFSLTGVVIKALWAVYLNGYELRQHIEQKRPELLAFMFEPLTENLEHLVKKSNYGMYPLFTSMTMRHLLPNQKDFRHCAMCGIRRDVLEAADETWCTIGFHCAARTYLCSQSFCSCMCRQLHRRYLHGSGWCAYNHEAGAYNGDSHYYCVDYSVDNYCNIVKVRSRQTCHSNHINHIPK